MTAETSNARGEVRMADIREDAREPLQLLREKLVRDEDGWAALCQLMPMLAAAPQPAAESVQAEPKPEARGVVDEGSRIVTSQLLHWGGIPVRVTGTVTTSPGNWPLIDAAPTGERNG